MESCSLAELENISAHHLYISHLELDDDDDGESSLADSMVSSVELDYSQLDRFGFIVVNEQSGSSAGDQEKRSKREARRALKWLEMMKTLDSRPLSQWPHEHRKVNSSINALV